MFSIEQAKQMAKRLRASLESRNQAVTHSTALETVAHHLGYKDWNTASAMLPLEDSDGIPPAAKSSYLGLLRNLQSIVYLNT